MPRWEFDLLAETGEAGMAVLDEAFADDPEACVSERFRLAVIGFSMDRDSAAKALAEAVARIEALGIRVKAVEPGRLAGIKEIMHMSGLGWDEVFSLASSGADDPFPFPVSRVTSDRPLWDMAEVAPWMALRGMFPKLQSEYVAAVAAVETGIASGHPAAEGPPQGAAGRPATAAARRWASGLLRAARRA